MDYDILTMLHMHVRIYTEFVFVYTCMYCSSHELTFMYVCIHTYVHLCCYVPVDFDECSGGLHNCSHVCVNTHGSHRCDCRQGYQLMEDGVTCQGEIIHEGLVLILVAVKLKFAVYHVQYICQTSN